jgi:plastocyanin
MSLRAQRSNLNGKDGGEEIASSPAAPRNDNSFPSPRQPLRLNVWPALLFLLFACFASAASAAEVKGKVVDEQGNGISQAVVFVQTPATGKAVTARKATLDQIDKQFVPSLLPIAVGTEVQFPNHDQIHHHVYSFSRVKSFDLPLYKGEAIPSVIFDQPGVVAIGCNIHDWMSATVLVVPSPHYATTDANGQFVLSDLPSDMYSLVAWHEHSRSKIADTVQQVRLDGSISELTFTLSLKPEQARPATSGQRGSR